MIRIIWRRRTVTRRRFEGEIHHNPPRIHIKDQENDREKKIFGKVLSIKSQIKIGKLIPAQEIENVRTLRMAEVGWGGSGRERERYGRDIQGVTRQMLENQVLQIEKDF